MLHMQPLLMAWLAGGTSYLMRCIPNIQIFLAPLETTIQTRFLPNLTGQPSFSDVDRKLFALPARLGGLGIVDPSQYSVFSFPHQLQSLHLWFSRFCGNLLLLLLTFCVINWRLSDVLLPNIISPSLTLIILWCRYTLLIFQHRSVLLSGAPGSSSWLTALPLTEHVLPYTKVPL